MGSKLKTILILMVALTLWFVAQVQVMAAPLAYPTSRIFGQRQIDTAVAVSQSGWSQVNTVLLASANSFQDALVASPLSHRLDAPILLTTSEGLDPKILGEIKRLGAKHVILLGGEVVLKPQVVTDLQKENLTTERIAGYDQYETAVKVAERVGAKGQVVIVNGEQFQDALAISSYAGITETPILLTNARNMPDITRNQLLQFQTAALGAEGAFTPIVVGGEVVVPSTTLSGITGISRLAGNDQYATAAKVFIFAQDVLTSEISYLVSGENFPDALVAGALAAKNRAGIFMSEKKVLPAMTYSILGTASVNSNKVIMIGGTAALTDQVKGMVEGVIQPKYLLAGVAVAVDPGHGGQDTGAIGASGSYEKHINLAVGLALADLLRAAGANVIMTRDKDVAPTGSGYAERPDLEERVKIANAAKADLFVSIHADSFTSVTSNGTTTYYSSSSLYPDKSRALGQAVQAQIIKNIGLTNRGVRDAGFYVINHTNMPSVLIELGFVSNPVEEKLLGTSDFQKMAAQGIYRGILVYRGY